MPEFIYHCPHCGQKMECDSEQFDGTVIATCPKCQQEICPEDSGQKTAAGNYQAAAAKNRT